MENKQAIEIFEKGKAACEKQDFATGLECFKQAADLGITPAMLGVGNIYHRGFGIKRDPVAAAEWYGKAGDAGLAAGYFNLGIMYLFEKGEDKPFPRSDEKASEYFKKAEELGDQNAAVRLAELYYSKNPEINNPEKGAAVLKKAADEGNVFAMVNLGQAYLEGKGLPRDEDKCFEWWLAASKLGDPKAMFNLAGCYAVGRGTPPDLRLSYDWLKKSADLKLPEAVKQLATLGWNTPNALKKVEGEEKKRQDTLARQLSALSGNIVAKKGE
ncbi:MAG: sel1 repeat family protein [Oscillospiraceae bacterium]|jgi:TPR repeat protein|nr:sel1 repeat family protein [Oscillospiraceae bacterium]